MKSNLLLQTPYFTFTIITIIIIIIIIIIVVVVVVVVVLLNIGICSTNPKGYFFYSP